MNVRYCGAGMKEEKFMMLLEEERKVGMNDTVGGRGREIMNAAVGGGEE